MVEKKIRVGILFGGKSAEHEVSLQSARNIIDAIDKDKYEPILIGITKKGQWLLENSKNYLRNADNPKLIALNKSSASLAIKPTSQSTELMSGPKSVGKLDVIFPVLHGTNGEDGTMQGMLKLLDIPFVGPSVLGSAVGMDKDVTKRLLRAADVPVADFIVIKSHERHDYSFAQIVDQLGLPFFVKPANLGSSVGVSKAHNEAEFSTALNEAFLYDTKILIEAYIKCREIECSVLGNEDPIASLPGEVIPSHEFYSYDAKYIDENGATVEIPANLPHEVIEQAQELAIKAFSVLCCEGMARVDFFLAEDQRLYVNEINTIPGFTKISMYPKLWQASGIAYADLIDKLISLALERHERDSKLQTNFLG